MTRTQLLCVCALLGAVLPTTGCSPTTSSATRQTTTTFGPTTTIDLDALNATWDLSGSWLIYEPGSSDADIQGFASFNPQVDGDRFVSTGYSQCFMFSGSAVETDAMTRVVPIEGTFDVLVECDPGPATDTYSEVVECLQAGCQVELAGDVLRLSTGARERVADLVRTADEIPPR